jgi:hypothetical protein
VHDVAAWLLETDRQTLRDDLRKEKEAEYAPLIVGEPEEMVRFCLDEATARMGADRPGSLHVDYEAAARWYAMAARFARRAQDERDATTDHPHPPGH